MNFSLIYLINRFLFRLYKFLYNWYIKGVRWIFHYYISILESLDYYFAVKTNIIHFFEPLYKDYSIMGRLLGIFFRSFRIVVGSLVYLFISLLFLVFLLIWILVPIIILILIFYFK
ncbi:MAG: hypothetical protein NZ484_01405 [Patescibacteria group bacterium]|nr:hypothetical protein [Patescibacteria group bacterium]MCX7589318.1 hypothetical protein [Patescibacteria group bacterium]